MNIILLGVYLHYYILLQKPEYVHLETTILAQWMLESNYGKSELSSRYFNYSGLKYRHEVQGYMKIIYTDSVGEVDQYFALPTPTGFCKLYFSFLERKRYHGIGATLGSKFAFLSHLQSRGFSTDKDYIKKIERVMRSTKFKELVRDINRRILWNN